MIILFINTKSLVQKLILKAGRLFICILNCHVIFWYSNKSKTNVNVSNIVSYKSIAL